jgi:hypothetical protein
VKDGAPPRDDFDAPEETGDQPDRWQDTLESAEASHDERVRSVQSVRRWIFGTTEESHRLHSLGYAIILALAVGLTAHVLHVGHHADHGGGIISGWGHWLRDSVLAVPLAGLVVFSANLLDRLRPLRRRFFARARWALVAGLGYSFLLIPGGLAHGLFFPDERHSGNALLHAISDAIALLPTSLYAAFGIAFVLGLPAEDGGVGTAVGRAARTAFSMPPRRAIPRVAVALLMVVALLPGPPISSPQVPAAQAAQPTATCVRSIHADVVALDQPFYYNRLGAIQANGMMYALARDVAVTATGQPVSELTNAQRAALAGQVSLRPDKRPRPIVLRMNEGDCLSINFTNLLDPVEFIFNLPGDFPTGQILGLGVPINQQVQDQPLTRQASIHIDGLYLQGDIGSDGSNVGQNTPGSLVDPGGSTTYTYKAEHEAAHLMYSMGATIGADGGGGARTYGLFGAVNVQKQGAEWYRSQLTRQEMDWATPPETFTDWNADGVWNQNAPEPFVDWSGDGVWNLNLPEPLTDWNGNGGAVDGLERQRDSGQWHCGAVDGLERQRDSGQWHCGAVDGLERQRDSGQWHCGTVPGR